MWLLPRKSPGAMDSLEFARLRKFEFLIRAFPNSDPTKATKPIQHAQHVMMHLLTSPSSSPFSRPIAWQWEQRCCHHLLLLRGLLCLSTDHTSWTTVKHKSSISQLSFPFMVTKTWSFPFEAFTQNSLCGTKWSIHDAVPNTLNGPLSSNFFSWEVFIPFWPCG